MTTGKSHTTRSGYLLALGATVGWSLNFLFSRALADEVPPFTLITLRSLVAALAFAPFAWRDLVRCWPVLRSRPVFHVFLALSGLGLYNAMVYIAGSTTSAVNMSLLTTLSPISTLLLGRILFGEPLTWRRVLGIGGALSGVILLTTKGDLSVLATLSFLPGDLVMLAAAFLFGAYTAAMRFKDPRLDNNALILATFLISLAFLTPLSAMEVASGKTPQFSAQAVCGVLYLGLVASIFCYWCWTNAIARIGPARTSLIYYTLPLFSGLEARLYLQEPLLWYHLAGGGLIVAGVLIATRN